MKLVRTTRTSSKAMDARRSLRIAELARRKEAIAKVIEATKTASLATATKQKRKRKTCTTSDLSSEKVEKKKRRTIHKKVIENNIKVESKIKTIHSKLPKGSDGGVEVCISFDTTGSMYSCLDEVRRSVKATIKRLLKDIPTIRIALVAHGDYGDEKTTYLIKTLDHTNDEKKLVDWVTNVEMTSGFDSDECYELVLRDVQKLSWSPTCQNRSLVLIGDANPHPLNPKSRNPYQIDWRKEAQKLKDMDIRVYAVHALNDSSARNFYQSLASITNGTYLQLPQFDSIVDFLCGICYGQNDHSQVEAYEQELRARRGGHELAPEVCALFDKLLGRKTTEKVVKEGGITPVKMGRFQTLDVDSDIDKIQIRTLVKDKGLDFKTGRGFYQFTKPENISMKKEIVLAHKKTGKMYTGESARMLLGVTDAAYEMKKRIKPSDYMDFDIFVQSTSYNRNLIGGTKFMYEVSSY